MIQPWKTINWLTLKTTFKMQCSKPRKSQAKCQSKKTKPKQLEPKILPTLDLNTQLSRWIGFTRVSTKKTINIKMHAQLIPACCIREWKPSEWLSRSDQRSKQLKKKGRNNQLTIRLCMGVRACLQIDIWWMLTLKSGGKSAALNRSPRPSRVMRNSERTFSSLKTYSRAGT